MSVSILFHTAGSSVSINGKSNTQILTYGFHFTKVSLFLEGDPILKTTKDNKNNSLGNTKINTNNNGTQNDELILLLRFHLHFGLLTPSTLSLFDLEHIIKKHVREESECHKMCCRYSLMMAALLVSFRKRNCFSFLTRSSSTSHTTSDSL